MGEGRARDVTGARDRIDQKWLIAGLRNGEAACYELLVKTYWGQMVVVARRLVQVEADAHDCVQEALLQLCRNIHRFEERSSVESWLHRIVVNTCLMKLRARTRQAETSLDDLLTKFDRYGNRVEPASRSVTTFDTDLEDRETRELVRQGIDQLPTPYRTVLILRDIEGYDTAETAAALDVTLGAVKVRLHRARSALRKILEPLLLDKRA